MMARPRMTRMALPRGVIFMRGPPPERAECAHTTARRPWRQPLTLPDPGPRLSPMGLKDVLEKMKLVEVDAPERGAPAAATAPPAAGASRARPSPSAAGGTIKEVLQKLPPE